MNWTIATTSRNSYQPDQRIMHIEQQVVKRHALSKGFKFDSETKEKINFSTIKDIVLHNREKVLEADQMLFKRNKKNWTVFCENFKKKYSLVYNKRVLFNDLATLPFGF